MVDIDDALLVEAKTVLGASTTNEAVNWSLRLVVVIEQRRRHVDRLATMTGLELNRPEIMSQAWR